MKLASNTRYKSARALAGRVVKCAAFRLWCHGLEIRAKIIFWIGYIWQLMIINIHKTEVQVCSSYKSSRSSITIFKSDTLQMYEASFKRQGLEWHSQFWLNWFQPHCTAQWLGIKSKCFYQNSWWLIRWPDMHFSFMNIYDHQLAISHLVRNLLSPEFLIRDHLVANHPIWPLVQ